MLRLALAFTLLICATAQAGFTAQSQATGTFRAVERFTPQNVVAPSVEGAHLLTANPGTWRPSTATFDYRWERESQVVGTAGTYNATADVGDRLRVVVTARNGDRVSAPVASDWVTIAPPQPPSSLAPPEISGEVSFGTTLTTSNGTWLGEPSSFTTEWLRCQAAGTGCTVVSTTAGHVLSTADIGFALRSRVTAANESGSTTTLSATSAPLAPSPLTPGSTTGARVVGSTLRYTAGAWRKNASLSSSTRREWWRCPTGAAFSSESCTRIVGATGTTYVPTAADIGSDIRAREYVQQNGVEGAATGAPVGPIAGELAATVTSSVNHDVAGLVRIADGKWQTSWSTIATTPAGTWVQLDFGAARALAAYDHFGVFGAFDVSVDGTSWTPVPADGPGWADGPGTAFTSPVPARYLRWRLASPSATGSAISEIRVWGS